MIKYPEGEEFYEELPDRIEEYVRNLSKSKLQDLALNLIYNLSDYELEEFAFNYLNDDFDDEYDDNFDDYDDEDEYFL